MAKSECLFLQGVLEAILSDYLTAYPSDTLEVERDIRHLSLVVETRGLATFLLDLPALGKHFDRCLDNGLLTPSSLPLGGLRWKKSPIPKLFSGLMMRVFSRDSGCLSDNVDVTVVAFLRQIFGFAKGYNYVCSPRRTFESVRDFYITDAEVRPYSLNWDDDRIDLSRSGDLHFDPSDFDQALALESGFPDKEHSVRLNRFCRTLEACGDYVATNFEEFDGTEWAGKHGPGAVSDLPGGVSKYSFPTWSAKLDHVFPWSEHAFYSYSDWVDNMDVPVAEAEHPSNLLMVPKTAKGPRLIASESTAHQWCQQILLRYLLAGIQKTSLRNSISLKDQEPSRRMVLEASHTKSHATIDLSAASDRVSCWLVERLFKANTSLLQALHSSRSRTIVNKTKVPIYNAPELLSLKKFSTMGSACTFPIQSIVFSTIAIATILSEESIPFTNRNFDRVSRRVRVFGDDIIVPNEHFKAVGDTLALLGLKVNQSKSYAEGNFRESCGMDAFLGNDVTPARLNDSVDESRPATVMSLLDSSNNFFMKGFWKTAAYIESALPHWVRKNLPVVTHGSGHTGLKSFSGHALPSLRKRWNHDLQREEVRCVALKSSTKRSAQPGRHDLFQFLAEKPNVDISPLARLLNPARAWEPGRVREVSSYLRLTWVPLYLLQANSLN